MINSYEPSNRASPPFGSCAQDGTLDHLRCRLRLAAVQDSPGMVLGRSQPEPVNLVGANGGYSLDGFVGVMTYLIVCHAARCAGPGLVWGDITIVNKPIWWIITLIATVANQLRAVHIQVRTPWILEAKPWKTLVLRHTSVRIWWNMLEKIKFCWRYLGIVGWRAQVTWDFGCSGGKFHVQPWLGVPGSISGRRLGASRKQQQQLTTLFDFLRLAVQEFSVRKIGSGEYTFNIGNTIGIGNGNSREVYDQC